MGKKKGGRMNINELKKEFLLPEWESAQAHGRCWNRKESNSPLWGSHITLINGQEAISLYEQDGIFLMLEFKKVLSTKLGERIREIFKQNGIALK